jgi:hypothetical protein
LGEEKIAFLARTDRQTLGLLSRRCAGVAIIPASVQIKQRKKNSPPENQNPSADGPRVTLKARAASVADAPVQRIFVADLPRST